MEQIVVGGELFSLGEMIGKGGEGRVFASERTFQRCRKALQFPSAY